MMLAILAESALRSLLLGGVVWIGLNLLRVRNPHVHMTCWLMVLVASLSMPLLMHWAAVSITLEALPVLAAATALAGREPAAGGRAVAAAVGSGCAGRGPCRQLPYRQLAGGGDGRLRHRRRHAAAATGARPRTDVAPGARRKAVACALDRQLARARERCDRRAGHVRIDHSAASAMHRLGLWQAPGRAGPRGRPRRQPRFLCAAVWPRSIARYSGSVRSHGGSLPGWPSLPNSSATQARWKSSKTGCPMPRSCSISCSASGARRRACKWQGRARCARGWSTFSPPPRPRQG